MAKKAFDYKTITSFEDACEKTGRDPKALPDVSMLPEEHRKAITAFYMLTIIMEAVNDDPSFPNWNKSSQWKYYPFFWVDASKSHPSGSGFSCSRYDDSNASTTVGSRLCCKSSDIAMFVAEKFEQLYIDMLLKV